MQWSIWNRSMAVPEERSRNLIPLGRRAASSRRRNMPISFEIGGKTTMALVGRAHIKSHLSLLNQFVQLRETIEEWDSKSRPLVDPFPEDKEMRWSWLVAFAVDRFYVWCQNLADEDANLPLQDVIPPIDVLMIWHTYLLNPRKYAEDCAKLPTLRNLSKIGRTLATSLAQALSSVATKPPSYMRLETWAKNTKRPFDVFEDARHSLLKEVQCPRCQKISVVPMMSHEGSGFLQRRFSFRCPTEDCQLKMSHSTLGARNLAESLCRDDLTSLSGITDLESLMAIKAELQHNLENVILNPTHSDLVLKFLEYCNFSLEQIHIFLNQKVNIDGLPKNFWKEVTSCYSAGYGFSVDLRGATVRQSAFISKMHDLQWTMPGYFDEPEREMALNIIVARYHAFLDLIAANKSAVYVPTLDVDLAWHTHQLMGAKYHEDCLQYLDRSLDHEDTIEEETLVNAFEHTWKAWQSRFHVPFTSCGCPAPTRWFSPDIGKLIPSKRTELSPYLVPEASVEGEDQSGLLATHPSEHNAVIDTTRNSENLARRAARMKRWNAQTQHLESSNGRLGHAELELPFVPGIPTWFYALENAPCAGIAGGAMNKG